jgi:fibronectin-binding autotransporter adhesin
MRRLTIGLLSLLCLPLAAAADTIHVPGDQPTSQTEIADPQFITGPLGDHFLTRIVDMGNRYTPLAQPLLVTGPGPGYNNPPIVRVFPAEQNAEHELEFQPYGIQHYGVNVTCGDFDGDDLNEILTGAGPGAVFGPHVRGFKIDGTTLSGLNFLAYGTNKYGVNVAAGDIDADGFDEIITGAGPGAVFGPHVRGWNYDGTGTISPVAGVSFFAYGTPKWGVNVSAGDIDGDGYDEIVTGAGPGGIYGPHVRGWNVDGGAATAMPGVSFLAYGTSKFGVVVTCGDVDGDDIDEIVTGPGPGVVFGTHIRGWNYDGTTLSPLAGFSFFAWPPAEARFGAKVFAGADLDGDGQSDLVVGPGPDPGMGAPVKTYHYDGSSVTLWFSLQAYSDLNFGTNVAAGNF